MVKKVTGAFKLDGDEVVFLCGPDGAEKLPEDMRPYVPKLANPAPAKVAEVAQVAQPVVELPVPEVVKHSAPVVETPKVPVPSVASPASVENTASPAVAPEVTNGVNLDELNAALALAAEVAAKEVAAKEAAKGIAGAVVVETGATPQPVKPRDGSPVVATGSFDFDRLG